MSKSGNYLGGSVLIKPKNPYNKPVKSFRLKKEFLKNPTAQYKMSFKKFKNLKAIGIEIN